MSRDEDAQFLREWAMDIARATRGQEDILTDAYVERTTASIAHLCEAARNIEGMLPERLTQDVHYYDAGVRDQ